MSVVFVHYSNIVVDIFLLLIHSAQAVMNNDGQFVAIGRIIGHTIRHGAGQYQTVAILVLQSFTSKCGAAGSTSENKALARMSPAAQQRSMIL